MADRADSAYGRAVQAVRDAAMPLADDDPCDALVQRVGDAHWVLLGEASHGTREFYRARARITRRLVREKGFTALAIEGDWPDAYRVNRFVRGLGDDASAIRALAGFQRFPTWMWRNAEVVALVDELRAWNAQRPPAAQCGFYGMDMYSLYASMQEVLRYLDRARPEAAALARERYACFDRFGADSQLYGLMTGLRGMQGCEDEVIATLVQLNRHALSASPGGGGEEAFAAEQNARLVKNAEAYYRSMYLNDVSSWNLRDRHMVDTLAALEGHLTRDGQRPKIVVWAHNSHLGDARATEMGRRGEFNVGQLMRERHGRDAWLVGFTTHAGTVTAASDWDGPAECKRVLPSRADSFENVMHATGIERFLLPLRDAGASLDALRQPRLERAIGVIYRPETERQSHYFSAELAAQFDAVIHIDTTSALEPLERNSQREATDMPETYPSGV